VLNEDEIIDLAGRLFDRGGPGVITGVGDDAAVIKAGGETWLWAADMLVEGIHFQRSWTPPQDLGRKVLAVNLSDMAAMGGEGGYALFSAALPDGLDSVWVEELFGGLAGAAKEYSIKVLGGDTTGSPGPIMLNLSLWGRACEGRAVLRSTGQAGDTLFVSRPVGAAAAALAGFKAGREVQPALARALTDPRPEVELGPFLAAEGLVSAMIDLSDGLGVDAGRLAQASGLSAVIEAEAVPIDPEAAALAAELGREALTWALEGGEDYALLMACHPQAAGPLEAGVRDRWGRRLFAVGRLEAGRGVFVEAGQEKRATRFSGFNHFAKTD